jgi:hypothetical protein
MAADFVQLTLRETFGIQRELNEEARINERPTLIATTSVDELLPNGRTREKRVFTMPLQIAKLVREAERSVDAAEA